MCSRATGLLTGILTVTGNYSQFDDGSFDLQLGGSTIGTAYDQLAVGGSLSLGGQRLNVSLASNFVPGLGSSFQVATLWRRVAAISQPSMASLSAMATSSASCTIRQILP